MSNTVDIPGVGEGVPVQSTPAAEQSTGHAHSHTHGHGHGHHSHAHKEGEDQWDGEAYVAKPGAKEVAAISAESIFYALGQVGYSKEDTKTMNLLEVGCGPGMVTTNLESHFSSIHAIDVSPSMLLAFSTTHSSPNITHSLHFLSPTSPTEFKTPLLSPLAKTEPERRLQPPRTVFEVGVANLVLHHVDHWEGLMQGLKGLLREGGWFVGTELGREEEGRDVLGEARAEVAAARSEDEANKHAHIYHGAITPSQMIARLESFGFTNVHAEIRGELKVWPNAPAVPCLVFWAKRP